MLQNICRGLVVVLLVIGYFEAVKEKINGVQESEPEGFTGVVRISFIFALTLSLWWWAGAFRGWFQ